MTVRCQKRIRIFLDNAELVYSTGDDRIKTFRKLNTELFASLPPRLELVDKTELVDKLLHSKSFLLYRIEKYPLTMRCNAKRQTGKPSPGADIAECTNTVHELWIYREGVFQMEDYRLCKGIDTRQVKRVVLLDYQLKVGDELIFCLFVELEVQTKKGRIDSGPFFCRMLHGSFDCLHGPYNHVSIGLFPHRIRFNTLVVTQCHMDQAALVRVHGTQAHFARLTISARSSGVCQRFDLLALAVLIALYIDRNRITISEFAVRNGRNDGLKSFERMTTSSDEDRKISAHDIEDNLILVTLVLIDFRTLCIEVLEHRLKRLDGGISYFIELLFGNHIRVFLFFDVFARVDLLFSSILYWFDFFFAHGIPFET